MKSYKFTDYTYLEIKAFIDAGCLAIVPAGCTEQQGPHLPIDFDTWFAETVALAAAQHAARFHQVRALVLPTMPFGPTPEHKGFGSGYVNLPYSVHEECVYFTLVLLGEQGFSAIVVWRGCGEHRLQGAVERFNAKFHSQCTAYLPSLPYRDIWLRVAEPAVPCGHADSFATSIAMYQRPEVVQLDRIPPPNSGNVDWADPHIDFTKYSETGVIGDATKASAELGCVLWNEVVLTTAAIFRDVMVENELKGRMRMGESCST